MLLLLLLGPGVAEGGLPYSVLCTSRVHYSAFTPNVMPRQKQAGLRGYCAAVCCVALVSDRREALIDSCSVTTATKKLTPAQLGAIAAVQQEGLIKNEAEMLRLRHSVGPGVNAALVCCCPLCFESKEPT